MHAFFSCPHRDLNKESKSQLKTIKGDVLRFIQTPNRDTGIHWPYSRQKSEFHPHPITTLTLTPVITELNGETLV